MRRVLTAAEMREADRRCSEDVGIPGAVLMNTAGAAVWASSGPSGASRAAPSRLRTARAAGRGMNRDREWRWAMVTTLLDKG